MLSTCAFPSLKSNQKLHILLRSTLCGIFGHLRVFFSISFIASWPLEQRISKLVGHLLWHTAPSKTLSFSGRLAEWADLMTVSLGCGSIDRAICRLLRFETILRSQIGLSLGGSCYLFLLTELGVYFIRYLVKSFIHLLKTASILLFQFHLLLMLM